MFDSGEIARRALLCAGQIKARRKRRRERLTISALGLGVCALAVCFIVLPLGYAGPGPPTQGSVTMLDGAAAGGYVLAGVIGFSLGAAVTIIYAKHRNKKTRGSKRNDGEENV